MATPGSSWGSESDGFFKVILRDINPDMVTTWGESEAFGDSEKFSSLVEVARCVSCWNGSTELVLLRYLVETYSKEPQRRTQ